MKVARDTVIPVALDSSYLHLHTEENEDSSKRPEILYQDEDSEAAGGIGFQFRYPMRYTLMFCMRDYIPFPISTEKGVQKWVIEKRGQSTVVYCNGKEVLNTMVSSETCDDPEYSNSWATYWGQTVSSISFTHDWDRESDLYKIGK